MLLREHSSTSCFPKLQLVLPLLSHVPLVSHCNLNQRMIQVHSCNLGKQEVLECSLSNMLHVYLVMQYIPVHVILYMHMHSVCLSRL